jgi:excisionase family DNA binding protein
MKAKKNPGATTTVPAVPAFPKLLRKKEVTEILNCSYAEIERMIARGELCYDYKRGNTALFKEETIHAYLESIAVKPEWRDAH